MDRAKLRSPDPSDSASGVGSNWVGRRYAARTWFLIERDRASAAKH
jgi:hypothetical protein